MKVLKKIKAIRRIAFASLLGASMAGSLAFAEGVTPLPLDASIAPDTLWETSGDQFVEAGKELGFRWISNAKDTAQTTRKGATLFGLPVCQTLVRVKDGKVDHVTALFYNRGDSGEIKKADYDALIANVIEAINVATETKGVSRGKDASSAVKAEGIIWNTPKATYLLESSFTREANGQGIPFRGEFVRLEITPREQPKSILAEAQAAREKAAPFRGADHVTRDTANGDVAIKDIPMVDQGQKGYCVVASAERVFRYYGVRVDANELAQLANSSASEGTSTSAMTESLKKLTARLRIRVRTQMEFDYNSFVALVSEYNRVAKRAKEDSISVPGGRVDISDIYARMKPDILREARNKSKGAFTTFERHVKTNIDKGVPVLWSVMLGVVPEGEKKQSTGGHMRLIIGYNDKNQEIIYSDSWGNGHEFKRMPKADAWAITTNMATVEPL